MEAVELQPSGPGAGAYDDLPDAIVIIDNRGNVTLANRAVQRLTGRSACSLIGSNSLDLVHPDDLPLAALSLASVERKEVGTPIELRVAAHDGWRLFEVIGAPLYSGHIVLTMRDLTERRRWEVAGGETAAFRSMVHHATALTMLLDADGVVRSVSGAISRQLGRDPELVCGQPLARMVRLEDRVLVRAAIAKAASSAPGAPATVVEVRLCSRDSDIPFELSIVSLLDDPTVRGLVVSGHDITRLRAAQEALAGLAHFDDLTGLPNRRAFDAALGAEWLLTSRDGIDSYVIVVDLNGFKQLNDCYGHATGDEALRQVSAALRGTVRGTDFVARLGGDEFGIILIRCGGEAAAVGFAAELSDRMREKCGGLPSEVTASVGHASLRASRSASAALHDADTSMYAQKRLRELAL